MHDFPTPLSPSNNILYKKLLFEIKIYHYFLKLTILNPFYNIYNLINFSKLYYKLICIINNLNNYIIIWILFINIYF